MLVAYDSTSLVMRASKALSGWLWVVAILGFADGSGKHRPATMGRSHSALTDRVGAYLSEAVLPVYVLHQTVIVLLAFYIVEWPVITLLKCSALSVASLIIIIIVVYDLAVRRSPPTRFLFGMKSSHHRADSKC
jgi:hypothetical protein